MRVLWATSALISVGLLGSACSADTAGQADIRGYCAVLNDCPIGSACYGGFCVSTDGNHGDIILDLTPPLDSGLFPQVDPAGIRQSQNSDQQIFLAAAQSLSGTIQTPALTPREGQLLLSVDPQSITYPLPSTRASYGTSVGIDGFQTPVPQAQWRIGFAPNPPLPDSERPPRPPWDWPEIFSTLGTDALVDLSYPSDDALITVTGRVVGDSSVDSPKSEVRVEGKAVGPDGPLRSAEVLTDELGAYALSFGPGAQAPFEITVRPGDGSAQNRLIPTITAELAAVETTATNVTLADFALEIAAAPVDVAILLKNSAGSPLTDTLARFDGRNIGAGGTFTASEFSDATGHARVQLLPGVYRILTSPPESSMSALAVAEYCIVATATDALSYCASDEDVDIAALDTETIEVVHGDRVLVQGLVRSVGGSAVVGGSARLQTTVLGQRRTFASSIDFAGRFSMAVDPGTDTLPLTYEIILEPVGQAGWPVPRHRQWVDVGASTVNIDIDLPQAVLFVGHIQDPQGRSLPQTRVEVFRPSTGEEEPRLIGLGQSDGDGNVVIALPQSN